MKYNLTISWKDADGFDCDERSFDNLDDVVNYVDTFHHNGFKHAKHIEIDINGRKIDRVNGKLVGKDGEYFCTNPIFHAVFADEDYPRVRSL